METNNENRLQTLTAILIAVAAVIGAVVAWRASVVADASGDADYAGLRAALFAEETRALNAVNAYEHYGAYTRYARYEELGNTLAEALNTDPMSAEQTYLVDRQRSEAYDLARANQDLFPGRFMSRDGKYNLQREMGEMWADAAREKDLNPEPQFAEADQLRGKGNNMLIALGVLAVSLVFYSLVEAVNGKVQWAMLGLGTLFLASGTVAWLVLELAK